MPVSAIEPKVAVVDGRNADRHDFPWGDIQWLVNDGIAPGCRQTFGVVHILPGQRNPLHYHPNCEEILYMVSGECDHSFDGQWAHLTPGMAICVPAGVRHNLENRGDEPVHCIISFSSGDRQTIFLEE
jgi:quercetin dioxygenase-like cupin family protein